MNAPELLNLLAPHQGCASGISAADLSRQAGITERRLRELITQLRQQGIAICAVPKTGYFLAVTPEELGQSCKFLHHRAMKSLRLASQMQKISMPDLFGQLLLNQA